MNVWQLENPKRERFYTSKTRQLHASHLKVGDRLWSCFPFLRPLATITADTLDYGIDADGAGVHDVIGSRQAGAGAGPCGPGAGGGPAAGESAGALQSLSLFGGKGRAEGRRAHADLRGKKWERPGGTQSLTPRPC